MGRSGFRSITSLAVSLVFVFFPLRASGNNPERAAPEHKSIHQLESETHRNLVVPPIRTALQPRPLAESAAPGPTHTVFGFYPYWAPGFSEIRFQDLTHLAVFSVEAAGSGQLVNLRGWPNGPLIQAAHQAKVRVVLVCTLFDSAELDLLLSSPAAGQALISNLKHQVVAGGADGINIDFERVPGTQRANLVQFMIELAAEIRTAVPGAHISIDTPAVDWSNAFDYAALADVCDALMIMGYDYYWSGSAYAGPVSPLAGSLLWGAYSVQWTVADYLTKVGAGRSKRLILGVPYYGYDWPVESDVLHARALDKATARTYSVAGSQAAFYGRRWDNLASTPWYSYVGQTVRQSWYDDAESLSLKYDLVFQNGLQGIGIWALTYDVGKTELWELIEQRFTPVIPPDPPEVTAPRTFFDTIGLPIALRAQGGISAADFEIAVGTTPGGTEVSDFRSVGLRRQVLLRGFDLAPGVTYFLTARSRGQQGAPGPPGTSVFTVIDPLPPVRRRYIPHWVSGDDLYTGLGLLNTTPAVEAFLIRGYIAGRADPIVSSWVLKPGEQMAELLSEEDVLGAACAGKYGWLEVSFQGEGLQSMSLIGDTLVARTLDGGPLLEVSDAQILPHLDGGRAVIDAVNPNLDDARVEIQLLTSSGTSVQTLSLTGRKLYSARVADLFPSAFAAQAPGEVADSGSAPSALLLLVSDRPIACSATLSRSQDAAVVAGLHLSGTLKEAAFSHVLWGGGYEAEAVLVNPSSEVANIELQLNAASASGTVTLPVSPASGVTLKLSEVFAASAKGDGDTLVRGSVGVKVTGGPGIVGSVWLRSIDYRMMAALPLETAATVFTFPQLAQGQGYWTGLSITNTRDTDNNVTVEALDAEGHSLGTFSANLTRGEQRVGLLYQWIPSTIGVTAGRVEIRSSMPLLATEIFGSDTLSFMTAVPGK